MDENYDRAITHYRKSYNLDTTFTDCLSAIANLYMLTETYDSALVCYEQIPYGDSISNSLHIGEIICQCKTGNIVEAETVLKMIANSGIRMSTKSDIIEIKKYLENTRGNYLAVEDSFVVFIPVNFKKVRIYPRKLVALLTTNDIVITKVKSIITEADAVPYYAVEIKPKPIHIPKPTYPESARKEGLEGQVVVKVLVDIDGTVLDAQLLLSSGVKALDDEALRVSMQAMFDPATIVGRPVKVWVSIPIKFRLN